MGAFNIVQFQGLFGTANVILMVMLITVFIGLVLLKKGLYNASANLLVTIAALAMVMTMFYNGFQAKNTDFLSFTYYMPVIIIVTALFSRVRWVVGISVFFYYKYSSMYCYNEWCFVRYLPESIKGAIG